MAANPFDITAPTPNAANLDAANNSTAQVGTVAQGQTRDATSQGYNAAQTVADGYDATKADQTQLGVNKDSTVQGQISGIIAGNSPLMQQAATTANQGMASRGLLNSSMAVGAGQSAVIGAALPIAQQDASTNFTAAKDNADTANSLAVTNAGFINNANQFNTQQKNAIGIDNTSQTNNARQFTAGAANTAELSNAQQANDMSKYNAGQTNTVAMTNAAALNANVAQQLNQSMQASLTGADEQTKIQLQTMNQNTQVQLANIEASYKSQIQASQNSTDLYQQTTKNIADLMANPDLDPAAKQAAIDAQTSNLQSGLDLIKSVTSSDVASILQSK